MQATTMDNLIKAKTTRMNSVQAGTFSPSGQAGQDGSSNDYSDLKLKKNLSSPRHMKRYIQQLVHAKSVCEKRLNELGCDPYGSGGVVGSEIHRISFLSSSELKHDLHSRQLGSDCDR